MAAFPRPVRLDMTRIRLLFSSGQPGILETHYDRLAHQVECRYARTGGQALKELASGSVHGAILSADMGEPGPFEVLGAMAGSVPPDAFPVVVIASPDAVKAQPPAVKAFIVGVVPPPVTLAKLHQATGRLLHALWSSGCTQLNDVERQVMDHTRDALSQLMSPDQDARVAYGNTVRAVDELVDAIEGGSLSGLLQVLRDHHESTFAHSMRVSVLIGLFGDWLNFSRDDTRLAALGGLVHDVGKRKLPTAILAKPARLDDDEMLLVRRHPIWSREILGEIGGVPDAVVRVAERHHERLDGSGYPSGLRMGEIDDLSLVVAVVDVFDALTDRRSYKRSMTSGEAIAIMRDMRGVHLETGFVDTFARMVDARGV